MACPGRLGRTRPRPLEQWACRHPKIRGKTNSIYGLSLLFRWRAKLKTCVFMLQVLGTVESCNILASGFRAKTQRKQRPQRRFLAALATSRLCVKPLLTTHRGAHGCNDGVCDSFLEKLVELCRREIEFDWRLFDPFDDRAFGKSSLDETDNAFVGQRRRLLELWSRTLRACRRRRLENTHGSRSTEAVVVLISVQAAACST